MVAGSEATHAIAERFGPAALAPDGSVDRRYLGSIVFADAAARRDLEAIVHPAVYRAIAAALRGIERVDGAALAVIDIPLLYQTGHAGDFDRVVATVCRRELQIARLKERGLSEREAEQRLAAQMPAEDKAARADFVITTDGSFAETDAQVDEILARLQSAI